MLYFDHSATTPLHPRVQDLLTEINREHFGNPSSIHRYGQKARALVEQARRQVAALIACRPSEIIFTSGGTEANNLALWNQLDNPRRHIVASTIEHPSILAVLKRLQALGVPHTLVAPDCHGRVAPAQVLAALRPDTGLVSVMLANNEVGTLQPVAEIAAALRGKEILLHTDAVQAMGKIAVNVQELGTDLLTLSAHKFYGPKGAGALYRRRGLRLRPLLAGGGQERGLRSGTENVAAIAGLGLAAELARENLDDARRHLAELEQHCRQRLSAALPAVVFNGHPTEHIPGLLSVTVPRVSNEVLLVALDLAGMAVSNGSACSAGAVRPSHVLEALGLSADQNRRTLRISFGADNSLAAVEQLADKLVEIVQSNHRR